MEVRLRDVAVMLAVEVMEAADSRETELAVTELEMEIAPGFVQVEQVSLRLTDEAEMVPLVLRV